MCPQMATKNLRSSTATYRVEWVRRHGQRLLDAGCNSLVALTIRCGRHDVHSRRVAQNSNGLASDALPMQPCRVGRSRAGLAGQLVGVPPPGIRVTPAV